MVRALNVFLLGCLLLVVGVVFLGLFAWALAAAGVGGLAPEAVAVGLAILLPCSFLLAGSLLPGPPRPLSNLIVCPCCGMPSPVWIRLEASPAHDGDFSDAAPAGGRGDVATATRGGRRAPRAVPPAVS